MVQNAVIIEERHSSRVELGSKVSVASAGGKEEHYTIVGSAEASPKDGRISNESPVGRALLGKSVGQEVQVQVPAGVLRLTITAID
jgi:transcription elongation factor GreA